MAIFVALIFQVLFVFFAMTINIGLVVHDKINLQNAVDLAAYYAAQRQAEWLNLIAHQNYQIRQAFKLLAWRYRVIGTMGVAQGGGHPARRQNAQPDQSDPVINVPVACIAYRENDNQWLDVPVRGESLCQMNLDPQRRQQIISMIRVPPVINIFGPWNYGVRDMSIAINNTIQARCQYYGALNYLFVNMAKHGFRRDQYRLKQSILGIARNLAQPPNTLLDLNGDLVVTGAESTFRKNLTAANAGSVQSFQLLNSLENITPEQWLNEIKINFNLMYADIEADTAQCQYVPRNAHDLPRILGPINDLAQQAFGTTATDLQAQFQDPPATDLRRASLGFEKNPWVRLYVGVRARTRPRQIFFPFGEPVQFEAVAYATPFGSSIGPWYSQYWAPGTNASTGAPIDPLLPPLVSQSSGQLTPDIIERLMPNYSRYPGDNLGLQSSLSMASLRSLLTGFSASVADYVGFLKQNGTEVPDFLAWRQNQTNSIRRYEVAAVAPDLFDASYYAMDLNFSRTYLPKLRTLYQRLGIPDDSIPRGDLGQRDDIPDLAQFSIKDQMDLVERNNFHLPEAFYFLRDRAHTLTSWVHSDTVANFDQFPENRFGRCGYWDDGFRHLIYGSCIADGGRTGYSVKIVNGQFLRSQDVRYGGQGMSGGLINPPPTNW
jgi:Flp pilus assembly protein TadG